MHVVEAEQMVAFRDRIRLRLGGLGSRFGHPGDGMVYAEVFKLISDL